MEGKNLPAAFSGAELSEKSGEALKSDTWQKAREVLKKGISETDGKAGETKSEDTDKKETVKGDMPENSASEKEAVGSVKERAKKKLEKELEKAKDKSFAEPVIEYLIKRCREDEGLSQDVIQKHKAWEKCYGFIYSQAQKSAQKGARSCAVRDDIVYEWAEDYYHKDDKAEEEKKAKEAAERKKKEEERRKRAGEQKKADRKNPKQDVKKDGKAGEKPMEQPKPKKNPKEMDGQMDMFSMMNMQGGGIYE